jgi:hypothetical protein
MFCCWPGISPTKYPTAGVPRSGWPIHHPNTGTPIVEDIADADMPKPRRRRVSALAKSIMFPFTVFLLNPRRGAELRHGDVELAFCNHCGFIFNTLRRQPA